VSIFETTYRCPKECGWEKKIEPRLEGASNDAVIHDRMNAAIMQGRALRFRHMKEKHRDHDAR